VLQILNILHHGGNIILIKIR